MEKTFPLPGISCDACKAPVVLQLATSGLGISAVKIRCTQCDWESDILEKGGDAYDAGKKRLKDAAKQIAKTMIKLKDSLPRNRDDWKQVIKDPKHPFTAALLALFLLVLMESSGFGVFLLLTWVLGNLVLNPLGWVLVPIIVAIVFHYRRHFTQDRLAALKTKLEELDQRRQREEISQEQYTQERDTILQEHVAS